MNKYTTKNVFIDTSVFERNNFFHGNIIHNLFRYSRLGVIHIYLTEISILELINRIEKRFLIAKEEYNNYVNSIDKKNTRILKNLTKFNELRPLQLPIEESISELLNKLQTNLENGNVKIINSSYVDINRIFHQYYNCNPPFNQKANKKHEFPDAVILNAVENWCIENKKQIYFLSHDNDFIGYKSRKIIFKNNPKVFLNEISKYYDSIRNEQIIPFLDSQISTYSEELNSDIYSMVKRNISFFSRRWDIHSYEFNGRILKSHITAINDGFADVVCDFKLDYICYIKSSIFEYSNTSFSKNDFSSIKGSIVIPCEIEVSTNKRSPKVEIKRINSNNLINIDVDNLEELS